MPAGREFVERQISAFNAHDPEAWTNSYAENAVLHDPQYPEPQRGREAIRKDIQDFFSAFPDIRFELTNVISEENRLAIEGMGVGTHQGPIEGPGGTIEPTNRRIETRFATFLQLDGSDLIAEEHRYYDFASMLQQLGLMP
jgi:steroid delta-isomerase-like uncharacterized protein